MKIAIEGCCHGELENIYSHIQQLEHRNGYKVDLLLICGDFQAMRNHQDLQCMACPDKYKELGGFYKYYSGLVKAPMLTVVIGGNHEASNYFQELYHGCIQVNGIRIAGASGIFKQGDFRLGQYEKLPYGTDAMRSIYHIREYNVRRLSLLNSPDIFLSHDWPLAIDQYGDTGRLLRAKKHFRDEVQQGSLGSPPLMGLLKTLKPKWWFSAHLHVRFEATVPHEETGPKKVKTIANPDEITIDDEDFAAEPVNPEEIAIVDEDEVSATNPDEISLALSDEEIAAPPISRNNPDEITLDDEEANVVVAPVPKVAPSRKRKQNETSGSETRFLALDKCLPRRQFLEVIDYPSPLPSSAPLALSFDPEWLAITKAFHPFLSTNRYQKQYPPEDKARELVQKEFDWVQKNIFSAGSKAVEEVQQFCVTAPPPPPNPKARVDFRGMAQPVWHPNPQTKAFCEMLDINDVVGNVV
ncbi:DBR1-domain-containing protein [Mycena floridula]|nr:DBR1-domain-containing protein [Mycena floridula]